MYCIHRLHSISVINVPVLIFQNGIDFAARTKFVSLSFVMIVVTLRLCLCVRSCYPLCSMRKARVCQCVVKTFVV